MPTGNLSPIRTTVTCVIGLALPAFSIYSPPTNAAESVALTSPLYRPWPESGVAATPSRGRPKPSAGHVSKRADFQHEAASGAARQIADWAVDSGDNQNMPFVIVDKIAARVFVFHAGGQLRGVAPALLGLAVGDTAVPGIGERKLSSIRPEERTTPAGRFVAALDRNLRGVEILWVDYEGAVSLHRVVTGNAVEQRLRRLNTPTTTDNRISYGCINVPVKFFDNVVHPAFAGTNGIVYVLPEVRSVQEVFGSYDVDDPA